MILVQVGLIHMFKCLCVGALTLGIFMCLLLSYAYIAGDRFDRDDMHQTAGHVASAFRIIPHADAAPSRFPASR